MSATLSTIFGGGGGASTFFGAGADGLNGAAEVIGGAPPGLKTDAPTESAEAAAWLPTGGFYIFLF